MDIKLKLLEVGCEIIVTRFKNNASTAQQFLNTKLKIVQMYSNYYTCCIVENPSRGNVNVFFNNPVDIFYPYNREKRKEYYEEQIKNHIKYIVEMKDKIGDLIKYPKEEDFMAHKLKMILDNKDDEQGLAKVIKELQNMKLI